jgi:hypothetical protein
MKQSIPCPDCASTGMKAILEEVGRDETLKCPHCGSRFRHGNEKPLHAVAQGCGFFVLMGICGIVPFFVFLLVSPMNPPWYYFVFGLIVLLLVSWLITKNRSRTDDGQDQSDEPSQTQ